MARYMLTLHADPANWLALGPDEMQKAIEKYLAWGALLRRAGTLVSNDKLADGEGRVVRLVDGHIRTTDGPFTEGKEVMGGYYLIESGSYDDAASVAGSCPHLELGGTIEVRRIDALPTA